MVITYFKEEGFYLWDIDNPYDLNLDKEDGWSCNDVDVRFYHIPYILAVILLGKNKAEDLMHQEDPEDAFFPCADFIEITEDMVKAAISENNSEENNSENDLEEISETFISDKNTSKTQSIIYNPFQSVI